MKASLSHVASRACKACTSTQKLQAAANHIDTLDIDWMPDALRTLRYILLDQSDQRRTALHINSGQTNSKQAEFP